MFRLVVPALLAMTFAWASHEAKASVLSFEASLSGPAESPPNASPGTGFAHVDFDTISHMMHIQVTFGDLLGTTIASHIHSATAVAGVGTAVVATQVPTFIDFPLGVQGGTYDKTFDTLQTSFYNPSFVSANGGTAASAETALLAGMLAGKSYLNIHTSVFPSGEIRGFLQPVPEPSSIVMLGFGLLGVLGLRRTRRGITH